MQSGDPQQSLQKASPRLGFLCLAVLVLSGTCELDPPTMPQKWEASGEGRLAIIDGEHGRMTRVYLSFSTLASPPENSAYGVYLLFGNDSLVVGELPAKSQENPLQIIWDEPDSMLILDRYQLIRINLLKESNITTKRRSFSFWWDSSKVASLNKLFAGSAVALQIIERAHALDALSLDIIEAESIDHVKAHLAIMGGQLFLWQSALEETRSASAILSRESSQFIAVVTGIDEQYAAAMQHADTLSTLVSDLSQSPEISLDFYHQRGTELSAHTTAIKDHTTNIYALCQLFAELEIIIKPD